MKTLAELQRLADSLSLAVKLNHRQSKQTLIAALRDHYWRLEHADEPLPRQITPMLLGDWNEADSQVAEEIENDHHAWIVQPKLNGVRALLHVEDDRIRVTSRTISETTFRLSELQDNLPHLKNGWQGLAGTILDGELVCPVAKLNTGKCQTSDPLQATVAILATSPNNAEWIQKSHAAHLRFHVFDILQSCSKDITNLPLLERQTMLAREFPKVDNAFIEMVPSYAVNKTAVHNQILESGGEGTVWKRLDGPYEPGRRVRHWLKRKRSCQVEGFVSGFKRGTPAHGNHALIGAVEFSSQQQDGNLSAVAWVSNWSDAERRTMTLTTNEGKLEIHPQYLGKRALLAGQDMAARSHRLRHARMVKWLDPLELAK